MNILSNDEIMSEATRYAKLCGYKDAATTRQIRVAFNSGACWLRNKVSKENDIATKRTITLALDFDPEDGDTITINGSRYSLKRNRPTTLWFNVYKEGSTITLGLPYGSLQQAELNIKGGAFEYLGTKSITI